MMGAPRQTRRSLALGVLLKDTPHLPTSLPAGRGEEVEEEERVGEVVSWCVETIR